MAADDGAAASGHRLPPTTRLGVVRLQVASLARSEEFYGGVLGLESVHQEDGRSFLRPQGGNEPLIELVELSGARPGSPLGRIGLYHYAILLPHRAELARFVRHAQRVGLRLGMSDHLVSEAVYLTDPDGLGIEVYADRPRSEWRSEGGELVMATHPLDVAGLLAEVEDEPFPGVPQETCIGHVHLHVRSLDEAEHFYNEALGLDRIVWSYPGALFLSAGGYHHHLGLNTWAADAPAPGPHDARLVSWSLVLPHPASVERTSERMASAGHDVTWEGARIVARDPWGTTVEVLSDA